MMAWLLTAIARLGPRTRMAGGIALALAAVLIALYADDWYVYRAGRRAERAEWQLKIAAERAAAAQRQGELERQLAAAQAAGAQAQERTRTVFRNIEKEVVRYVETAPAAVRDCGLDADGLRLWNAANAGAADPAAAGGGPGGLSGVAASQRRATGDLAVEPRRGGAAVPRMQGQPSPPGEPPDGAEGAGATRQ